MIFGNKIRELREKEGLILRKVASQLDIDTATLSKIELGDRLAKREHINILSEIYGVKVSMLKTLWLADQIHSIVSEEEEAILALEVALKTLTKKEES